MIERTLVWDGCVNVRDLGGHPTEDGGQTLYRRVVRADCVRRLSDAGWRALVDYGVRRIVDLRHSSEVDADPPHDLPIEALHVPLFDDFDGVNRIIWPIKDPVLRRQTAYLEFLARFRRNFALAVAAVAAAPDGPVVVHCEGGVDRTGLVAALILRLAGVRSEEIAADYAVSGGNWAPMVDAWIAEADDEEEREHRRLLGILRPEMMLVVLQELERRHGSVHAYLLGGGASEAELARVRTRLRG